MTIDPYLPELLKVLTPPDTDWMRSRTESVLANLVGAVAVLVECRKLIRERTEHLKDVTDLKWKVEPLVGELENAIDEDGHINWNSSLNFSAWAMGLFLNKAEENVAAALDKCTTAWLGQKSNVDFDELDDNNQRSPYIGVRERLRKLAKHTKSHSITGRLNTLHCAFSKDFTDPDNSRQLIKILANECPSDALDKPLDDIISNFPKPAQCTALIWGSVNRFKHRVQSTLDREGMDFYVEYVIAQKAIKCVGGLWQDMLEETEPL